MNKKIVISTILIMLIIFTACNANTLSENDINDENNNHNNEKSIVNVEINNEEDNNTEDFSDDTIIPFGDEELLKEIRKITGIVSRDITYGDVKNITELELWGVYSDISPLKYFTGLKILYIGTKYDKDLSMLSNCKEIMMLGIVGDEISTLSGLSCQDNLKSISLNCKVLTDISELKNCTELFSVKLRDCDKLTDINTLKECSNLHELDVWGCNNLIDYRGLGEYGTTYYERKYLGHEGFHEYSEDELSEHARDIAEYLNQYK